MKGEARRKRRWKQGSRSRREVQKSQNIQKTEDQEVEWLLE